MNHHEQHHQHHRKEREHEKHQHAEHGRTGEKNGLPIHPRWFFITGVVLVIIVVAIWVFLT